MNKFKWKFQKKLNRESSEQLLSLLGSSAVPGSSTQESSHELQKEPSNDNSCSDDSRFSFF